MKDDNSIEVYTPSDNLPPAPPSTYDLLIRQSKKLGAVATRAFVSIRTVLNREITLPPAADTIFHSFSLSKRKTSQQEIKDLQKMVRKSNQVIARAKTVFPMTLFPHSVVVDRAKITIIKRDFFWTSRVISIQIEDILNVETGMGPFFGSLTIASRVMSTVDHFQINYFWRHDAIFLKHIIQGYVIAKHNNIDTSRLSRQELIETLTGLGHDSDKR